MSLAFGSDSQGTFKIWSLARISPAALFHMQVSVEEDTVRNLATAASTGTLKPLQCSWTELLLGSLACRVIGITWVVSTFFKCFCFSSGFNLQNQADSDIRKKAYWEHKHHSPLPMIAFSISAWCCIASLFRCDIRLGSLFSFHSTSSLIT